MPTDQTSPGLGGLSATQNRKKLVGSKYIDTSLFASESKINPKNDIAVVSIQELRDIRNKTEKGQKADAIIIKNDELRRIKDHIVIKSPEKIRDEKKMKETMKEQSMAAATMRKNKMKQLDVARESKVPQSDLTQEQQARAQGLLSKAQMLLDEQLDDVKKMNQIVFYSKVVTVRDKQLIESKQLEQEYIEEQKKLDLMMEIERLKSLKVEEERTRKAAEARKHGAQVIIDQIADRYQDRIKENEIRDRERQQMKIQVAQMEKEEERAVRARQEKARQMLFEVEASNQMSKTMKAQQRQREKDEDIAIMKYNQSRQLAEYERQEEEKRIKEEKEREVQKLREMQEKAADRQAEIDALRAKRAFEAQERQARNIEKLNMQKRTRLLAELDDARAKQFMEKEDQLRRQAEWERNEFERIILEQKASEERDRSIADQKRRAFSHHKEDLTTQINQNSAIKKQHRLDYLEEGRKMRMNQADEILKLETIKMNKLQQMKQIGISDKYAGSLVKQKIKI